jgi:hypothetical protein
VSGAVPSDRTPDAKAPLLYLDQNYLSGIVKRKPGFRELEPVVRAAVACGAVSVPESRAHRIESAPRPDLPLIKLLRELSGGLRLPEEQGALERACARRLERIRTRHFPRRRDRVSDEVDLETLAIVLPRCRLIACDAFMADVVHRSRLDLRFGCDLFSGRRADVERLRRRLQALAEESACGSRSRCSSQLADLTRGRLSVETRASTWRVVRACTRHLS